HETHRRQVAADDAVIRFTDQTPTLDGRRDNTYATIFTGSGADVSLASDPLSLFVFVSGRDSKTVNLAVFDGEQVSEHRAAIRVAGDGRVNVANGMGQTLLHWSRATDAGIEIQIPYQIHRPQRDWMTAVEHGRHRMELSGKAELDQKEA